MSVSAALTRRNAMHLRRGGALSALVLRNAIAVALPMHRLPPNAAPVHLGAPSLTSDTP